MSLPVEKTEGKKAKIYPSTSLPVLGPFVDPLESLKVQVNECIRNLRTLNQSVYHDLGHIGGYHDGV